MSKFGHDSKLCWGLTVRPLMHWTSLSEAPTVKAPILFGFSRPVIPNTSSGPAKSNSSAPSNSSIATYFNAALPLSSLSTGNGLRASERGRGLYPVGTRMELDLRAGHDPEEVARRVWSGLIRFA